MKSERGWSAYKLSGLVDLLFHILHTSGNLDVVMEEPESESYTDVEVYVVTDSQGKDVRVILARGEILEESKDV